MIINQATSSRIANHIFVLYLLLATCIYVLSVECISPSDIAICKEIIHLFQVSYSRFFRKYSQTGAFHTLCHLPDHISNFGPLSATSAYSFKNVNRFLKQSITGTSGQGLQIGKCFVRYQI